MKLLLTSTGFTNPKIGDVFVDLLDKDPNQIRVLFIPTASRTEQEMFYVRESESELIERGILKENILWFDVANFTEEDVKKDFDVVYVCGGNTFFLMAKLKESGLDKKIVELVNNGAIYVGASAGSVAAGPDISIAGPFDENDIGLKDMAGLCLMDIVTSPHYNETKEKIIIEEFEGKLPYKIVPLTDSQALLVKDDKTEVIE